MIVDEYGQIPDVNCLPFVCHEEDLVEDAMRESIRSALEEYLLTAADQRLARFSVLRFYNTIRPPRTEEEEEAEPAAKTRSVVAEDFRYFLDLPPSPEEIRDSEVLVWELRQAWLASYWGRVERISDRMGMLDAKSRNTQHLRLARLLWAGVPQPQMPLVHAEKEPGVFESGWLIPFYGDRIVAVEDREWLRRAATRIRGLLDTREPIRPFYLALLADCCAYTDDFLQAARIWEENGRAILIDRAKDLVEFLKANQQEIHEERIAAFGEVESKLFIARCLDQSAGHGDREKAIQVLHGALEKYPDNPAVHRAQAELLMHENRIPEALQHVRKERDLTPESEEWGTTLANLAWRAAYFVPEKLKDDYLQSKSAGLQKRVLRAAIDAHWPLFKYMSEDCQEKWIDGTFWLFAEHDASDWSEDQRAFNAGTSLGVAVEWELMRTVFRPFKEQKGTSLMSAARENQNRRLIDWCNFLIYDRNLSLGTMRETLKSARGSAHPLFKSLETWLDEKFAQPPTWKKLIEDTWDPISKLRNRNLHFPPLDINEAKNLHRLCHAFLDILLRLAHTRPTARRSPGRT